MPIVQKIKDENRNYMSEKFDKNQLLTFADLPISRTTAWRLMRRGKLRCYRINRRVYFDTKHVEELLLECETLSAMEKRLLKKVAKE